jgi:single-strand DNA-binding protein
MLTAFVTGNLGKDGELRQAGNDKVLSFNVASSRKVKGNDVTTWVSCSVWGKRAEALATHMSKGKRVAVTGELSTREHNGKTYLELRVSEIDFMGGGKSDGSQRRSSGPDPSDPPDDDYGDPSPAGGKDDLPF